MTLYIECILTFHTFVFKGLYCMTKPIGIFKRKRYKVSCKKYSRKWQSAGSDPFRPKLATLTLIPRSRWHQPPCSSKICATHTHDKPRISPNWFYSYMLMEFIAPPIGWAQHALVGRFPVLLWTYPPRFVMMGQREWELWPIISKPHPLQEYTGPWQPYFLTNRNLSFHPPKPCNKFGVDRVNLSKVLFILLFFTSCKLVKNL